MSLLTKSGGLMKRRAGLLALALAGGAAIILLLVVREHVEYRRQPQGPDRLHTAHVGYLTVLHARWLVEARLERAKRQGDREVVALLRESIPASLERPALGAGDPAIARGESLPNEYVFSDPDDVNAPVWRCSNLFDGKLIVNNGEEYAYAYQLVRVCQGLWDSHSVNFVEWMAERADIAPPRRLDVLIDWSFPLTRHGDDAFWKATGDFWRRIARGKNPIYRGKAVFLAPRWAKDWPEERAVYLAALEEQDGTLIENALYTIAERGIADPQLVEGVKRVLEKASKGSENPYFERGPHSVRGWALYALQELQRAHEQINSSKTP